MRQRMPNSDFIYILRNLIHKLICCVDDSENEIIMFLSNI